MDLRRKTPDRSLPAEAITKAGHKTERLRRGSAIILAVVLTTLLAILGVLFLFSSRVDSVATSAVGDNHDLKLAVDTVVSQISQVLAHNVPGVDPNGTYYNYPDGNNPWLACLEPYQYQYAPNIYRWQHVTDLYNNFGLFANDINAGIIYDHSDTAGNGVQADADGDGVSDSMWVQIQNVNSSKGKPIYAAIRIIDNGGMLNVNTGYWFNANADPNSTDGSSQTQINLLALAQRPGNSPTPAQADNLVNYRCGSGPNDITSYTSNVIWQYGPPNGSYTPFDISDELEMRYRFVIDQNDTHTRWESWDKQFDSPPKTHPFDSRSSYSMDDWFTYVHDSSSFVSNYSYRHIATTYNCDRIIDPNGNKMFNINSPLTFDSNSIYNAVRAALPSVSSVDVAQIAANLMDYIDGPNYSPVGDPRYDPNNKVTAVPDSNGTLHYGFETPCVYISEIAQNFYKPTGLNDPNFDPLDPNKVFRSYAVELFKPYSPQDDDPNGWTLLIMNPDGSSSDINIIWTGPKHFHVLANIDPKADIPIDGSDSDTQIATDINFSPESTIKLYRDVNGVSVIVDLLGVNPVGVNGSVWMVPNPSSSASHSFERDITVNRCIRRVLNTSMTTPTLGRTNSFTAPAGALMIQAHPANKQFANIGEIGQLLSCDMISIDQNSTEEVGVRLNIADPCVQNLFKYLTVIDPTPYTGDQNETRIKGRININTAPWFVLAQLPWVSYNTTNYDLARSIANYRDTYGPFKNIGQLMNVGIVNNDSNSLNRMDYYMSNAMPPGLATPTDCNGDAFEERDVIFDRISNLITVRSDVFTAYILVRIGTNGPQKRVVAIFDRSEVPQKPVKIIAIQQVPDPR
jgi:DNA uptake protein ComE-like DNA-binding protein